MAHKLGITFSVPLERRIAGAEKVGKHKTSMLQDVEAGRPLEIEALLGSVVELARLTEHAHTAYRHGLRAQPPAGAHARAGQRLRPQRRSGSRDGAPLDAVREGLLEHPCDR